MQLPRAMARHGSTASPPGLIRQAVGSIAGQASCSAALPALRAQVKLSAVSLTLCEQQLRDGARLLEYITEALSGDTSDGSDGGGGGSVHGVLPPTSTASMMPRARWRRALDCVCRERQRLRGWRLEPGFFERRRHARLRYTELWKRSQGKVWLSELDKAEKVALSKMEREEIAVEDIVAPSWEAKWQGRLKGCGQRTRVNIQKAVCKRLEVISGYYL